MPQNKKESLIYTVLMCFVMVLWMTYYNVILHTGQFTVETLKEGWIGFPIAYIYAIIFDWFVVSKPAKTAAFRFFIKPDSQPVKKIIAVSTCMVVPMVIIMSFFGGLDTCLKSGEWNLLAIIWLTNIPKNIIMALPFQLLIAGPLVRRIFRKAFPEGCIMAS